MDTLTSSELIPSIFVVNQNKPEWNFGQIQYSIKNIVTVDVENVKKKVININEIHLGTIKL